MRRCKKRLLSLVLALCLCLTMLPSVAGLIRHGR